VDDGDGGGRRDYESNGVSDDAFAVGSRRAGGLAGRGLGDEFFGGADWDANCWMVFGASAARVDGFCDSDSCGDGKFGWYEFVVKLGERVVVRWAGAGARVDERADTGNRTTKRAGSDGSDGDEFGEKYFADIVYPNGVCCGLGVRLFGGVGDDGDYRNIRTASCGGGMENSGV